jgi:hypothetical protein
MVKQLSRQAVRLTLLAGVAFALAIGATSLPAGQQKKPAAAQAPINDDEYTRRIMNNTPDKRIMMGGELQWGQREDNNGEHGEDFRIQFSFKYNFSSTDFFK